MASANTLDWEEPDTLSSSEARVLVGALVSKENLGCCDLEGGKKIWISNR